MVSASVLGGMMGRLDTPRIFSWLIIRKLDILADSYYIVVIHLIFVGDAILLTLPTVPLTHVSSPAFPHFFYDNVRNAMLLKSLMPLKK